MTNLGSGGHSPRAFHSVPAEGGTSGALGTQGPAEDAEMTGSILAPRCLGEAVLLRVAWLCRASSGGRCCSLMAATSTRRSATRDGSWEGGAWHLSLPTGAGAGRGGRKPTTPTSLKQQCSKSPSLFPLSFPCSHHTQGDSVTIPCPVPQFLPTAAQGSCR